METCAVRGSPGCPFPCHLPLSATLQSSADLSTLWKLPGTEGTLREYSVKSVVLKELDFLVLV